MLPFDYAVSENTYINFKIFGDGNGFLVVAIVMLPDRIKNSFDNAHIVSQNNKTKTGKLVDKDSKYWSIFEKMMPKGFHIIEGQLGELTEFTTARVGLENIPIINTDLDLKISYGDNQLLGEFQDFHLPAKFTLPMPSRDHIIRVAGGVGELGFLLGGGSWFTKLNLLIKQYTGRDVSSFEAILDWGCGCGRILRHFVEAGNQNVYGVDIDKVNIRWIQEVMNYKKVFHTDYDPPLPFDDSYFDLIYGHSVFTHLSKEDHDKWIAELYRVLRPGGYAFLTVCTEFGTYLTRHSDISSRPQLYEQYLENGIEVFEVQSKVGVDSDREGYYKLVSHTTAFIKNNWGKKFDVCRIIPAFAEHQDLVIIHRPL